MSRDLLLHFNALPLVDSSYSAHTVTVQNVALTTDSKFGANAVDLQKVSGDNPCVWVSISNLTDILTEDFSLDFHVKGGDPTASQYILRVRKSNGANAFLLIRDEANSRYELQVNDNSLNAFECYADFTTCSASSRTEYHHIGITKEGGTVKLFVNQTLGGTLSMDQGSTTLYGDSSSYFEFSAYGDTNPLQVDEFLLRLNEVIDFATEPAPTAEYDPANAGTLIHQFNLDSSTGTSPKTFPDRFGLTATLQTYNNSEVSVVTGGKFGSCAEVDLTTVAAAISASGLSTHKAMAFWFKLPNGFPTSEMALLDLSTTSYEVVFVITSSGNIDCHSGYGTISTPIAIPNDNAFHCVVVNFADEENSGDLSIYLDNGTASTVTGDTGTAFNLLFGWGSSGTDILLDYVLFYDENLVPSQRAELQSQTEPYGANETAIFCDITAPMPTVDSYVKLGNVVKIDVTAPMPTVDSYMLGPQVADIDVTAPMPTIDSKIVQQVLVACDLSAPMPTIDSSVQSKITPITIDITAPMPTVDALAFNVTAIAGRPVAPMPTIDSYFEVTNPSEHETVNFLSFPIREQIWQGDNEKVATPVGTLVEAHGGRLLIAIDNEVFFTEYGLPGLVDDLENRLRFGSRVLMILSVGAGVYISDEKDIYYCEGQNPKKFIRKKVLDFPAKEWCISDKLIDPSKLGLDTSTLSGLFMTSQGPFIGLPDGMVFSVYDKVYESSREYLTIAEHDGEIIASGSSGGLFIQGAVGGLGRKAVAEISDNYLSVNHTDGVAYGAKADGLYKLDEDYSGGGFSATISSHDFNVSKTKKCRSLYFGIDTDSSFKVYTSVDDGAWVEYDATNVKTGKQRIKVPISHIQRGRYWSVKIESDDYFKLDHIRGVFIELSAGRYGV